MSIRYLNKWGYIKVKKSPEVKILIIYEKLFQNSII